MSQNNDTHKEIPPFYKYPRPYKMALIIDGELAQARDVNSLYPLAKLSRLLYHKSSYMIEWSEGH
ncbi:hypothetical protein CU633_07495 [Bacillus sp. V3-13]|nr:hypothetical protein CU633_07495 [Bacillus sp. V3-13]